MATLLGALRRNWTMFRQPLAPKKDDALKFGILGAANIADMGFITPSKSHPEVIVYAVAARDKKRAVAYAKRHGIPEVRDSYQAILDDPAIDAVYIPTPNGLHFEWALKALAAGKHVLLEKPSTSNAHEAELLFKSPLLSQPRQDGRPAPVLMEAFHSFFVPSWRLFLSLIDRPSLAHVHARAIIPSFVAKDDDIRFDYGLAGGSAMDVGTYTVAAVRTTLGVEPEECVRADLTPMAPPRERCDGMFHAQFRFPGDVVGEVEGGLRGSNFGLAWPSLTVRHRAVAETAGAGEGEADGTGTETRRTRKVVFVNFMFSPVYHRIDVEDEFVVTKKDSGEEVRRYVKRETRKAYSFREMGADEPGELYWPTYRYELEQFVNRVRGREGNGTFFEHENSMAQMRALDMIYEKSGLGLRPTSEYRP